MSNKSHSRFVFTAWLVFQACLSIAEQPITDAEPVIEFGLVMDETMTKPDADFYDIFSSNWQANEGVPGDILIQEQPGALRSSYILLWLNDELIFKQRLPLRYDKIETLAHHAIKQVSRKLLETLFIQREIV